MSDELSYTEWIKRAEDDLKAVESLLEDELYALACFHAQQCAEKALKAFLLKKDDTIPKIHALPELLDRCAKHDKEFAQFREIAEGLDKFYQPTRYPDAVAGMLPKGWPGKREVEKAQDDASAVLEFVTQQLNV